MYLYCLEAIVYPKELVVLMMLHLKLLEQDLKDSKINLKIPQRRFVQPKQQLMQLHQSNLNSQQCYRY
jgi:hypothetical protein